MAEAFGPHAGLDVLGVVADGHRGLLLPCLFVSSSVCQEGYCHGT
ncbi:MAG: hypothetical protein RLZZ396_1619 [Planctomycetota bacterium]